MLLSHVLKAGPARSLGDGGFKQVVAMSSSDQGRDPPPQHRRCGAASASPRLLPRRSAPAEGITPGITPIATTAHAVYRRNHTWQRDRRHAGAVTPGRSLSEADRPRFDRRWRHRPRRDCVHQLPGPVVAPLAARWADFRGKEDEMNACVVRWRFAEARMPPIVAGNDPARMNLRPPQQIGPISSWF